MSKKKHKNRYKSNTILNDMDDLLTDNYSGLVSEISDIQARLSAMDKKTEKKARKKLKKDPSYNISKDYRKNRLDIIREMENSNLLVRLSDFISDITPILISISRLIICLILSILSISGIKAKIKPSTLEKLNAIVNSLQSIR